MNKKKVLVIGGSNIDYFGLVKDEIVLKDSNIGEIEISFGGVARNIAENLARLGLDVTFITTIGNTYLDKALEEELKDLSIKIIKRNGNYKTSSYLAVHDSTKDMVVALCDQHINDALTISFFKSLFENDKSLLDFQNVVIDTNLNKETIEYLVNVFSNKRIFIDAISTSKASRLKNVINKISFLKCNMLEFSHLFHNDINLEENLKKVNCNVIISNGANDIIYSDNKKIFSEKVIKLDSNEIVNFTGAGDALLSGIVYGIINGKTIKDSIIIGTKVSHQTIKAKGATSKNLKL